MRKAGVHQKPHNKWVPLLEKGTEMTAKEYAPPVELVAGLLVEGTKFIVGGAAKSKKTWLQMNQAVAMSTGTLFLGRPTIQRPVLYVNLELSSESFGRRLKTICRHLGVNLDPDKFWHLPLRGKLGDSMLVAKVDWLLETAEVCKSAVMFLDPLYKLNAGGEENTAGPVTTLFNELDRLTVDGCQTVVITDHAPKGDLTGMNALDLFRGSGVKGGDVDGALTLRHHIEPNCFRVDVVARDLPEVQPFVIRWEYPVFTVREDLDPEDMRKPRGGKGRQYSDERLLQAISGTDLAHPISITKWAESIPMKRQTLSDYTPRLRANGWIATVGEGLNARQYITNEGLRRLETEP